MNFPLFVDLGGGGGYMFIKIKVSTFPTDNFNGSLTLTLTLVFINFIVDLYLCKDLSYGMVATFE